MRSLAAPERPARRKTRVGPAVWRFVLTLVIALASGWLTVAVLGDGSQHDTRVRVSGAA